MSYHNPFSTFTILGCNTFPMSQFHFFTLNETLFVHDMTSCCILCLNVYVLTCYLFIACSRIHWNGKRRRGSDGTYAPPSNSVSIEENGGHHYTHVPSNLTSVSVNGFICSQLFVMFFISYLSRERNLLTTIY